MLYAKPSITTLAKSIIFLNCIYTHIKTKIRYKKWDIILHINLDIVYLIAPSSRSQFSSYYYLSAKFDIKLKSNILLNEAIHLECKLIQNVVSSAVEAENRELFINY